MTKDKKLAFAIRAATQDDLPKCLTLDHSQTSEFVWQVDAEEAKGRISYSFRMVRLPRPVSVSFPKDPDAMLAAWQAKEYFMIAEGPDGIYGYLNMRPDYVHSIGWVSSLIVDKPRRRQRVGTALLQYGRRWAQANRLRRVTMETQTKNFPAIAFCQRQGFVLSGFNDRYYPNQDIALFFTQSVR